MINSMVLLGCASWLASGAVEEPRDTAQWIWCESRRVPGVSAYCRKQFDVDRVVTSAVARAVGDSASVTIYLDGTPIMDTGPYDSILQLEITERLHIGKHILAVHGKSCAGPAAFFVQLDLTFDDNTRQSIVTDSTWLVSKEPAPDWNNISSSPGGWQPAIAFGAVSGRLAMPSDGLKAVDNYEQWKQALGAEEGSDPASFSVAPGFEIQLVRSAGADEDSWVSLAFDPQGRAVIAMEKKGLLRMTLSSTGDTVSDVERINDSLEECRGLLFAFGDLFVNANNSKGLYRLRNDGKDHFSKAQLLYSSLGGVGHGRNDIALGPDGKIYMIHGDSVRLPEGAVDYTSPLRDTRNGNSAGEGHLLRIDPDGNTVEILAAGLRNPFGIDFNTDGECFTYDADAEYDMGSPWYRPTRVNHLVIGGDYGWRAVTKSWPPYYPDHPDNARPTFDVGKGSPTAVKFGTNSNFPEVYRRGLFILDWTYGRILAVHLAPRGSSYLLGIDTFLQGRPLNVTDLDFAPDGSMYVVTGGRQTQSALYRIRYVGAADPQGQTVTAQQKSREQFARQSRELRRQLESYLQEDLDKKTFEESWQYLANSDPSIRLAARNIIERVATEVWQERAFVEPDRTASLTALLALARSNNTELRSRILRRLCEIDWSEGSKSDKQVALYTYWLCLKSGTDIEAELLSTIKSRINAVYPDRSYELNRLLSTLAVSLNAKDSISKTIELLKSTSNHVEHMHYLFVLRNATGKWTLEQRRAYFHGLAETRHYLGGAGMSDFVNRIRQEATSTLSAAEREGLAQLLDNSNSSAPAEPTASRPFVRKWTVGGLLNSQLQDDRKPDLDRGEAMFATASCIKCHRIAGRGTLVGPDLTAASSRFSRRDLLESIVSPSKVIPDKFRSVQIVTADGKSYVGQVVLGGDYRSPLLRLATDPTQPHKITEIPKSSIDQQSASPVSWMPEGLLDTLHREEILDLLAYIEARGVSP